MFNRKVHRISARALLNTLPLIAVVAGAALIAGCGEPKLEGPPPLIPGQDANAPKLIPGQPPGGLPGATPAPEKGSEGK